MTPAGEARIMAAIGEVNDEVKSLRGAVQETREEAAGTRAEVKAEVKGLRRYVEDVDDRATRCAEANRVELVEQGKKLAAVEATGKHPAVDGPTAVRIVNAHPSGHPKSRASDRVKVAWIGGVFSVVVTLLGLALVL